jgi:hypothetical protein
MYIDHSYISNIEVLPPVSKTMRAVATWIIISSLEALLTSLTTSKEPRKHASRTYPFILISILAVRVDLLCAISAISEHDIILPPFRISFSSILCTTTPERNLIIQTASHKFQENTNHNNLEVPETQHHTNLSPIVQYKHLSIFKNYTLHLNFIISITV